MEVKERIKRYLKLLLKLGFTAVALYFVFRKIELAQILELYQQLHVGYLLLALLLFAGSKFVAAFRLNVFFSKAGLELPASTNLQLYLLGMFYNLFLPGGIGGDGYKIYILQKKYKTGIRKLFGAVLTDRLSGMAALIMLALIIFSFHDIPIQYHSWGIALIPAIIFGFYLFIRWFYKYFISIISKTLLYSIGVQLLQLSCAWMILLALGQTDHSFSYLLIFLVSSIVAVLPISIGGVGVRELTFLYGAEWLGIDINLAVGISLLFYLITLVVSFGGIYCLIKPIKFD